MGVVTTVVPFLYLLIAMASARQFTGKLGVTAKLGPLEPKPGSRVKRLNVALLLSLTEVATLVLDE